MAKIIRTLYYVHVQYMYVVHNSESKIGKMKFAGIVIVHSQYGMEFSRNGLWQYRIIEQIGQLRY